MKRCSNCGAQLPDDELFCPRCGEEVQLVPIFETVESSIKEQQRILEEKERERQAIMEMEAMEREKTVKKRNTVLVTAGIVTLILVAFFSLSFLLKTSKKSAFNKRYTKAVEAYDSGDYDSSLELITEALEKDPGNMEGKILMADIYAAQGKTDMSAAVYQEVIQDYPDSESAYKKLIGMYEILGQGSNIHTLLANCTSQTILDKFSSYLCTAPVFSLEAGTYETIKTVELSNPDGYQIRYTLDGSDPSLLSLSYNEPIALNGGTIKVRAVCFNAKGVPSDTIEAEYNIKAKAVDPPIVFPRATSFTFDDGKTHAFTVIVPKGHKALYSFDTMPTAESTVYTGPVDMLEGNHSFYAILMDKKTGAVSTPTSLTYSLTASNVQENITIVQDSSGNMNASYSDGTVYVPENTYVPEYNPGNQGGGGGYVPPAPAPAPVPDTPPAPTPGGGGSSSGGGSSTPEPDAGGGGGSSTPEPDAGGGGSSGGGGGEVAPDPGTGGGGEVAPDPGTGGGGEVAPDPGPAPEEPAPEPAAPEEPAVVAEE